MRRSHGHVLLLLALLSSTFPLLAQVPPPPTEGDLRQEVARLAGSVDRLTAVLPTQVADDWLKLLEIDARTIDARRAEMAQLRASQSLLVAELGRALDVKDNTGVDLARPRPPQRPEAVRPEVRTEIARFEREIERLATEIGRLEASARSTRARMVAQLEAASDALERPRAAATPPPSPPRR